MTPEQLNTALPKLKCNNSKCKKEDNKRVDTMQYAFYSITQLQYYTKAYSIMKENVDSDAEYENQMTYGILTIFK